MRAGAAGRKGAQLRVGAVALFAMSILLAIAGSALAAEPIVIGEPEGSGAGEYLNPRSVAVRETTGDIYLSDRNNSRTTKFDVSGAFRVTWGRAVADPLQVTFQHCGPDADPPTVECYSPPYSPEGSEPRGLSDAVAVDQGSGDVYSYESFPGLRVEKYNADGEFLLMFGKNVNDTPGTPHPDICTAADLSGGDTCSNGDLSEEPVGFGDAQSLTVAPDGKIWVSGFERVQIFNPDGTFDRQLALPGQKQIGAIAVDSSGDLFATGANNYRLGTSLAFEGVRKFDGTTGTLLESLDEGGEALTIILDSNDNLYVGDQAEQYRFMVFNAAGEQILQFGAGQVAGHPGGSENEKVAGIGLDESRAYLYAVSDYAPGNEALQRFTLPEPGPLPLNERAEDVQPTTATLEATVNPEGHATEYHFEYGTDSGYGESTPATALPGAGFEDEPVQVPIDHLVPGTTYHFRLVASNHCNPAEPSEVCTVEGEDATFTTPDAVVVGEQWATQVRSNSATLHAELDPLGVEATWWLEYGTDGTYGSSTLEHQIPATFGPIRVQTNLLGLTPGVTYHYRFVARDERDGVVYTVHGADHTFATQGSGLDFRLPDGRAWEMVTPAEKFGASIINPAQGVEQAAADGSGFAYQSEQSVERDPEGSRALDYTHALARRDAGNWTSEDLSPPYTEVTPIKFSRDYEVFSPDLSRAVLEPRDATPLSPEASEMTPYLRENFMNPVRLRPFVTSKEPFANVPPGTIFGEYPISPDPPKISLGATSSDLRHVLLQSYMPLMGPGTQGLYLWEDGKLKPASVMPDGTFGGGGPGSGRHSIRHAVSDDGSRVFWENSTGLYVRDFTTEKSARLDTVQPGAPGQHFPNPVFQGASADGSVVYFTTEQQLTPDASPFGYDLYRCEIPLGAADPGCASLTNLTAPVDKGENSDVQNVILGMGDDGQRVYFVARGVLTTAPNDRGESAVPNGFNLYLWQEGEGVRLVAPLAEKDYRSWGGVEGGLSAQAFSDASPDGRYLAFMSFRSLTGYDNRDAVTSEPLPEVFRYDAIGHRLDCVSCNPTGGRPIGEISSHDVPLPKDPGTFWPDIRVTALLSSSREKSPSGGTAFYEPRRMLDNGRVFFNALDPLVPGDSNGNWDVYQSEPTGVGDCTASSGGPDTVRSAGGCVSLISSGTGEEEAAFLDASESGDDVFFLTTSRLSVLDRGDEYDIYDARVNGIPATLPPQVECRGEACQPAPSAPNDPTPASSAFHGAGNLKGKHAKKRCAKGKHQVKRKGKVRCVKKKGKSRQHRAQHGRRAGR